LFYDDQERERGGTTALERKGATREAKGAKGAKGERGKHRWVLL